MENKTLKTAGILLAYPIAFSFLKYFLFDLTDVNVTLKKTIFVLAYIIWNEIIVRGRGKTPPRETYFWYGIMGIVALTFTTGLSEGASGFGLWLSAMYVAIVSNGICYEGRTGSFIVADLFNAGIIKAFTGFPNIFLDLGKLGSSKKAAAVAEVTAAPAEPAVRKRGGSIVGAVLIILVMIPIFIIAVGLLCEINESFDNAVSGILESIDLRIDARWLINNIGYIIFAVPTSLYLYGMISKSADSDGSREKKAYEGLVRWRQGCRRISPYVSAAVAGIFVLLYLVFFVFEGSYLFSAFAGVLPEEFTAAQYARRGFFELTGIMFINMLIFLLIHYFENRELAGRKISCGMICALMSESVLFATISFSKLALYYSRFGYTPKRLLAIWGTLIFAAGAVMVIISTLKKKDLSRIWIIFTTVSYAAMSIMSSVLYLMMGGVDR